MRSCCNYVKRVWRCLVGLVFSCVILATAAQADEVVDRIVAVVNGEIITLFDINQQLKAYLEQFEGRTLTAEEEENLAVLRKKILQRKVDDLLLEAEAERLQMTVSDVEVKNQIEAFKRENGFTEEALLAQLKLQGMTRAEYETVVKRDIMRHRLIGVMVRRKVVVTEEEIKAYYENHRGDFSKEKKIELALIIVEPGFDIDELYGRITRGELSFAQAAAQYSIGPAPKQGGKIGAVHWADMREPWKDVLHGLNKGDISKPFDLDDHQALLHVVDFFPGESLSFEDSRDKIRDVLYRPKMEKRFAEYLESLHAKAVLDIRM